jgi:sterol desaturase/sphingolipid hydroxylase (fatty acid hydroxylase superfamily)
MHALLSALLVSLAFDAGRYVLVAIPTFFVFWVWLGPRLRRHWLRPAPPDAPSTRREIAYSISTIVVFALASAGVYAGSHAGIFRLYLRVADHGVPYLIVSTLLLIVVQDTYFYVTHRAMHHRLLFRVMHRVHHLSRHTSPFTAYAFSPLEAAVHAAYVPLMLLVVPLHPIATFLFLGFMFVRNVLGHLAIELYPAGFATSRLGRAHTTATHHALHHQRPGTNFGLYFTFWDRLLGTTDPTYEARFEAAAGRGRVAP